MSHTDYALLEQYGFTAVSIAPGYEEDALVAGLLAELRLPAVDWHPLHPAYFDGAMAAATEVAQHAVNHPHVVSVMLSPAASVPSDLDQHPHGAWFTSWLSSQTGLSAIPDWVRSTDPVIVADPHAGPSVDDYGLITVDDPAFEFIQWFEQLGKGWPQFNAELATVLRVAGLHSALMATDQPRRSADATGLDLIEWVASPLAPSGAVTQFNRAANLAELAGVNLKLTTSTFPQDPQPATTSDGRWQSYPAAVLRELLWITVAQPLDHMGLAGWELLSGEATNGTEYCVRDGLSDAVTEQNRALYPIGLLTAGLKAPRPKVAYLETTGQYWLGVDDLPDTARWFNRMATQALAEAGLRFDWIHDDHLRAGWLDSYDTVFVLGAWRLPADIHQALEDFTARGGHVVTDEYSRAKIAGAQILPLVSRRELTGDQADDYHHAIDLLQGWVADYLRAEPAAVSVAAADGAWLFRKQSGQAEFIFAINDARRSNEDDEHPIITSRATGYRPLASVGVAQDVVLRLPDASGVVYDVRQHSPVDRQANRLSLHLKPADAAVLAWVPEPIAELTMLGSTKLVAGTEEVINLVITTNSGARLQHRDLLEVELVGEGGGRLDMPRFYRVDNGSLELPLRIPRGAHGRYSLRVFEWLSGLKRSFDIQIYSAN